MSSVVVSGDSSNGAASPDIGGENNPIELDDSSSDSDSDAPPGALIYNPNGQDNNSVNVNNNNSDGGDENENDQDDDNDSEEDDEEEISESDGDDEMNIDAGGVMNESVQGDETEDENEHEDENENEDESEDGNDNDNDNDNNSAAKGPGDAFTEVVVARVKAEKKIWGNIESMSEIVKSPYEGDECAEVGEGCFDELKTIMDCSEPGGKLNPQMEALFGDKLARALNNAHYEIGKSGMLYGANWREGKIRDSDVGWIPKRQLLLCLHEQRFARGNEIVLQAVTRNLDCFNLVLEAMKMWNLTDDYPNLASNRREDTFIFGTQKVGCYKCQIFVARAFATLQILNKTHGLTQSLTRKIKACLTIMNDHVRVNQIELARMKKKSNQRKTSKAGSERPIVEVRMDRRNRSRRSESAASRSDVTSSSRASPIGGANYTRRRRKIQKCEEREESLLMSFGIMHTQVQRLNQMMSFFQTQLQDHRGILREEIREQIERERQEGR